MQREGAQAGEQSERPNLLKESIRLVTSLEVVVRNTGAEVVNVMKPDIAGKPLSSIRLQSLGVEPSFENFKIAKSTYLKISDSDKAALGQNEFKNFSIMMMYSDFMKCRTTGNAQGLMRFLPETRFGPPEKSYYTEDNITNYPGLVSNVYGKGATVLIPWALGEQYHLKGHYMHRRLFVAALQNLLRVQQDVATDASPLIEMTHIGNRNGAFEWIGMINQSGQIGASLREPVTIYNTHIRFKPAKAIKALRLMHSGKSIKFKQSAGWVQCTVPALNDFDMLLCLY